MCKKKDKHSKSRDLFQDMLKQRTSMSKHKKMFEEREEVMLSPHKNGDHDEIPKLRRAFFLKPTLDTNLPHPKPPSLSLSSKPNISLLKDNVSFKGRAVPQEDWDTWVDNLQQTHQDTWKKVGIFDAIRASTYKIVKHNELILGLAEKWCPETNTFLFRFGEATITLEDVMILGGFSVLGECVRTPVRNREFEGIENDMLNVFPWRKECTDALVMHSEWMSHFMGVGGEIEHTAFLVLWLSRYVFSTKCYGSISPHVFPIAIRLARGTRIALAPAVLAAIYRDLSVLKAKIVEFVNNGRDRCSNLVLWAPFQRVQIWVWERFTVLGPKPDPCDCDEPRLARWKSARKAKIWLFRFEFESLGECFLWRPYSLFVRGRQFPELYCDESRSVLLSSETRECLISFARCLRPCELVGFDCVEQYLPHRVGLQFGMDQDIPSSVSRCNNSLEVGWSTYDMPLDGEVLCLPPRLLRGEVTARYFDWWRTESYHCAQRRRRSKRIAKNRSRNLNVCASHHGIVSTVSLSESTNVSNDSSILHSVVKTHIEATFSGESIRKAEDSSRVAPCCSHSFTNCMDSDLCASADEMCTESTPCFDKNTSPSENLSQNVDMSAGDKTDRAAHDKSPPSSNLVVICKNVPCKSVKKVKFALSQNVDNCGKNKMTEAPPRFLPSVDANHVQDMDIGTTLPDRASKYNVHNHESTSVPLQSYPQSVVAEVPSRMNLVSVAAEVPGRMKSLSVAAEIAGGMDSASVAAEFSGRMNSVNAAAEVPSRMNSVSVAAEIARNSDATQGKNHTETGVNGKIASTSRTNSEQSLATEKESPTANNTAVRDLEHLQRSEQMKPNYVGLTVDVEQGLAPASATGSLYDPLLIEDDNNNDDVDEDELNNIINAFKKQDSELESRISKLEAIVSVFLK